jgi:DNA processing protein
LDEFRDNFSIQEYFLKLQAEKVKFFTLDDPEFPKFLSGIKNPPFVLYVKGDFDFVQTEDQKTVVVVGTRRILRRSLQYTWSI